MEWLFCVSPNIIVGLASALGCLYFLLICAEETRTLLAYRQAMRVSAEPLARHRRVRFPRFPRDIIRTSAAARCFVPADARLAPSRL